MFVGNVGMLVFFMLGGAFRAAGDARTPLRLGIAATVLNAAFNVVLIPRSGAFGAALGTVTANLIVAAVGNAMVLSGRYVVRVPRPADASPPTGTIIRSIFRFGLPTGLQGIAMNVAGVLLLRFIGSLEFSAAAQAAYAVGYTELFSLITWTSVGLMSAAATIAGQNLGRRQARAQHRGRPGGRAHRPRRGGGRRHRVRGDARRRCSASSACATRTSSRSAASSSAT